MSQVADPLNFIKQYGSSAAASTAVDMFVFNQKGKIDPKNIALDVACFFTSDQIVAPFIAKQLKSVSPNMPKLQRKQLARIFADIGLFLGKSQLGLRPKQPIQQIVLRAVAGDVVANNILANI